MALPTVTQLIGGNMGQAAAAPSGPYPTLRGGFIFGDADGSPNPNAIAELRFTNTGNEVHYRTTFGGSETLTYDWLSNLTGFDNTDWEIKCDVVSGFVAGDSQGIWLDLSTSREWRKQISSSGGSVSATINISIRQKSDNSNIDVDEYEIIASGIA